MRCVASRIGFVIDRTRTGIPGKLGSGATTGLIQPYSTWTRSSGKIAVGVALTMADVGGRYREQGPAGAVSWQAWTVI